MTAAGEKAAFVRRMQASHRPLAAWVARLSDTELARPVRADGWSTRDILVHLAAWYEVAAERLRLLAEGRADQIQWVPDDQVDAWNAEFHARSRTLSAAAARERFGQAYRAVLAAVDPLPDERWRGADVPVPLERWLAECTFEHEEEHRPELDLRPTPLP